MQIRTALMIALMLGSVPAHAQEAGRLRELLLQSRADRFSANAPPAIPATETIAYGQDPEQVLDFWRARDGKSAPLIIFVHGGGWQHGSKDNATGTWKPTHYLAAGYNFASINYRLVPRARVEDQAHDVALAVKALLDRAKSLGINPAQVVLMGHSAGAHLVALVGTDPQYLTSVGLRLDQISGVVPIDGAAFDVPRQMREGPPLMQPIYETAFGTEARRQIALSPTLQAAAPNVRKFFIPHVQRPDGIAQSEALASALRAAGTAAETLSVPGTGLQGHAEINRRMGDPSYEATPAVDAWLKRLFGR